MNHENHVKPWDNLILETKFFDSKLKLSHGLICVERADMLV